ncbi:LLM class flavin-dependent oxidoreductase [Rhizobium puerariae]|uniref:LLM class flavin-dependent oxidoreductase n=1 Tax=Rhizobium puerariae TaxID=1585791 RepID=A0ABV6AEZ9_9HYPH
MRKPGAKIKFGVYGTATGANSSGWRHPDAAADMGMNIEAAAAMAQLAEDALMDFVFLADSMAMRGHDWEILSRGSTRYVAQFEPLTLLSALAMVTTHIGLVATLNTSYEEPYLLARRFASLDLLSGGRAGWNLVTSSNIEEAGNFSREEHPDHAERYDRAIEFARIVRGLWFSWDDNAFPVDKQSGIFFDARKLHLLNHKGKHFSVRGPLNVPPSPQRHPVMVQAGASEPGKELAAEFAETIFGGHATMADAQKFYADVKGRMAKYGRSPDELVIMPGVSIYVADSKDEAQRKRDELLELVDPVVGRDFLKHILGDVIDLSRFGENDHLPRELPPSNANKSYQEKLLKLAHEENLTLRQLYMRQASKGAYPIIGTPSEVADELQQWFEEEAADGFIFLMDYFPTSLEDFKRLVVPELQRRGLYRTAYEGTTLRGNLGLPLPRRP